MKIEYSADRAIQISRRNSLRSWYGGQSGESAKERLLKDQFIELGTKSKFLLGNDHAIFTLGSCFARNIENVLLGQGKKLLLKGHGIAAEYFETWDEATGMGGGVARGELSRGAFNKYTIHSMSHELRRTLLNEQYSNEGLIELATDRWFDPHSSGLKLLDFNTALANRHRISEAMACIKDAAVVFLTFGLTETWLDTCTGLSMNVHPGAVWLARMPERFQFVDYGYDDSVREITSLINLIRDKCNPEMHFIVTVSPVPLGSTFKDSDVIVANSASKSKLRTIAEELFRTYEFVDYFPSYEMVMCSPRALAWENDQLHVSLPMIEAIMAQFERTYYHSN